MGGCPEQARRIGVRARLRSPVLAAAIGLLCLYLAVMSGHFLSIDGLVMWRQALALAYHHSFSLVPSIWWSGTITSSYRGVGASLQYVPGALFFFWLRHLVPVQAGATYDFALYYKDLLYTVAGAPVWAAVTAGTAGLTGLIVRAMRGSASAQLWAMAFYGLGSPALAASRGDWPQPLVALCWALGVYACLRYNDGGGRRWLWVAAGALVYGVLTRPLEGSMLLPGILVLLLPGWRDRLPLLAGQVAAWVGAVGLTLLLNWARFGSPLQFGYGAAVGWTTPIWVGPPGDLVSPGRGILWEFPAVVLAVFGAVLLWRRGSRLWALALAGLPVILFAESSVYVDWEGGWDWGYRFIQPALPLLAALAAVGVASLPRSLSRWLPWVLLAGGIVWNVPVISTDLLAGYGKAYADTGPNWSLDAYPPIGAWRFIHANPAVLDIVWFRATRIAGPATLLPFVVLLAAAAFFWRIAVRAVPRMAAP